MTLYRSGRTYRNPPIAHGGHAFVLAVDSSATPRRRHEAPELFDAHSWNGPPLWRCVQCYGVVPEWAIRERFLRPCTGNVRAIEAPT